MKNITPVSLMREAGSVSALRLLVVHVLKSGRSKYKSCRWQKECLFERERFA